MRKDGDGYIETDDPLTGPVWGSVIITAHVAASRDHEFVKTFRPFPAQRFRKHRFVTNPKVIEHELCGNMTQVIPNIAVQRHEYDALVFKRREQPDEPGKIKYGHR